MKDSDALTVEPRVFKKKDENEVSNQSQFSFIKKSYYLLKFVNSSDQIIYD